MLIVVNEGDISAIFVGRYETHNEIQHYTGSIFNSHLAMRITLYSAQKMHHFTANRGLQINLS